MCSTNLFALFNHSRSKIFSRNAKEPTLRSGEDVLGLRFAEKSALELSDRAESQKGDLPCLYADARGRGHHEEVDPILKSVFLRRQAVPIVLLAALIGAFLPSARAQKASGQKNFLSSLQSSRTSPQGMVPGRRAPMVGDSTFLPKDVPVRSLEGVQGFDRSASSRVRIGGANGANVIEKIVNLTRTSEPIDERTPYWTTDERFLYYSSNTAANARYGLFRIDAQPPSNIAPNPSTALTNTSDTQYDYLFPTLNNGGTRIAFIRSSDGRPVDDPQKRWDLYVSNVPVTGQVIDTGVNGVTDLRPLTPGRSVPINVNGQTALFTNVGRPAWIGSTDLVFSAQVAGDTNYHLFTVNFQTNKIFQLTSGAGDERNPQVSPNARLIAFDSDALPVATGITSTYTTAGTRPRTDTDLAAIPAFASAKNASGNRNIFVTEIFPRDVPDSPTGISTNNGIRQITGRYAGAPDVDNAQPAWSSQQNNSYTNQNGFNLYLAFSSARIPQFDPADTTQRTVTGFAQSPTNTRSIYYVVIDRTTGGNSIANVFTENPPTDFDTNGSDGARRIDTANDTLVNGVLYDVTQPRFSDQYPAFAPFITVFRTAFQSNRNGDLNLNAFGSGFTLSPANNLFIASLVDITAPTLIRYDTTTPTGEVVHENIITSESQPFNRDRSDRNRSDGITPGSRIHFAVRVDDRESGMRPENSADGGAVYIQIKNPNSKYQSQAQGGGGLEHKEYTDVIGGAPGILRENNVTISLVNAALGNNFGSPGNEWEAQAVSAANPTLYYGHLLSNFLPSQIGVPVLQNGAVTTGNVPLVLYVPGIQDQQAFIGTSLPPLDGGTYTTPSGQRTTPNVWLRLTPLVHRDANGAPLLDANNNPIPVRPGQRQGFPNDTPSPEGGVLYGAAWTVPTEASDWYLDVILYDNAVSPFNPSQRSNVIIYDNVWGFSSAPPIAGQTTDVLVVADYPLGQKFFQSRFGTLPNLEALRQGGANLQPILFGVESYYTDRDLGDFPSEQVGSAAPATPGGTQLRSYSTGNGLFSVGIFINPGGISGGIMRSGYPNVLGVSSYNDQLLDPFAVDVAKSPISGGGAYRLNQTGRYNIWRILSRGPVPVSLLNDYLPRSTTAPADTANNEAGTAPRNVLDANRMVVWMSPFSGNNFVGAGTITDLTAQNNLTAFVQSGGRLFISGQDVGFALVGNGQTNTFYTNILKAQFVRDNGGGQGMFATTQTPAVVQNGVANYVGQLRQDPFDPRGSRHAYGYYVNTGPFPYSSPADGAPNNAFLRLYNRLGTNDDISDGSPSSRFGAGFVDVIRALPSTIPAGLPVDTPPDAVDVFLYNGSPAPPAYALPGVTPTAGTENAALIASAVGVNASPVGLNPPYNAANSLSLVGKTAYSAEGFESVSQGWYVDNNVFFTVGRRAEIMHNITCSFRTGTLIGRIIDNDGSPVSDALVRAIPNATNDAGSASGTALTDANGNFQVVGLQPGYYVLFGYQAGYYTQHDLGRTVHGGARSATTFQLKKAGPGSLSGVPNASAPAGTNKNGGVFDSSGTPLAGIEVQVRRLEPNGRYVLLSTVSAGNPDPNVPLSADALRGQYSFPNLLIADPRFGYVVIANPRTTIDPNTGQIVPNLDANGNPRYNPNYGEVRVSDATQSGIRLGAGTTIFPNTDNTQVGPTVVIREGQASLIDFLLPAAPGRIIGQVVNDATGAGIAGAVVTATPTNSTTPVAQGTTDANGNYTLSLINPPAGTTDATLIPGGTYNITVTANGYASPANPTVITVVNQTVTVPTIRLTALPPGSVSGLVRRFNGQTPTTAGVTGATVTFYAVTTVGGVQTQSATAAFTATVVEPTTNADGYTFNYRVDTVPPGTYNAYVDKPGLTGSPSPFANITVTTGQETRSINFSLEPPKIYGQGIQLISTPVNYSQLPTAQIFGYSQGGDNDANGITNAVDAEVFRLFNIADWTGTQYNISPDIRLQLGKGYFARFGAIAAVTAQGVPNNAATYPVSLTNGWNLIGHPFTNQENPSNPVRDIDLSDASLVTYSYTAPSGEQRNGVSLAQAVTDGAMQGVAYSYTGSNAGSTYVQTTVVKQWFGYWVRTFVPVQVTFRYPGGGTRAVKASKVNGGRFVTVTREQREAVVPRQIKSKSQMDWRLQIAAAQGDLRDTDNTIGVAPDAHEAFDNKYDNQKPPMVEEAATLYVGIGGTDAQSRATVLSDNVKAPTSGTKTWDVTVETTGTGDVTLTWPNINRLPRGVEPVLVDVATGKRVAMRNGSSSFRFAPTGRAQRKFRVEVAPAASIPLDIVNLHSAGSTRGGAYQFRFTPTRAVEVDTRIQTMTGRTVRRVRSRAEAGTESAIAWDGRDELGGFVPTGPYMLEVTVRDERGQTVSRKAVVQVLQ